MPFRPALLPSVPSVPTAGSAKAAATASQRLLLAPLRPTEVVLAGHHGALRALFHALGEPMPWFRRHAMPLVQQWESWSAELAPSGVPRVAARRSPSPALPGPAGALPLQLDHFLQLAVVAARQVPATSGDAPWPRLRAAHLAVLEAQWRGVEAATIQSAGACWSPTRGSLRGWRRCHPGPAHLVLEDAALRADPWRRASQTLAARGIWRPGHCDRWLRETEGWALLWPLAGRDLLTTLAAADLHLPDVEAVRQGLAHWGHLRPGRHTCHDWVRADGRVLQGLSVANSLLPVELD